MFEGERLRDVKDLSLAQVERFRLEKDTLCLLVSAMHIVGGIAGICVYILLYGSQPQSLIMTLAFAPAVLGVYAGILLWRGKEKGLRYCLWLLVIQIPVFMSPVIGHQVMIGTGLFVGWLDSSACRIWFGYVANLVLPARSGH